MTVKASEREGKPYPLSFRVSPELRAKLEDAASRAGRSLTSELEIRLELSFCVDEVIRATVADLKASE